MPLLYTHTSTLPSHFSDVTSLAVSPNCTLVACGGSDHRLLIFDLPNTDLVYEIITTGPVLALEWVPYTDQLVCGIGDGTIVVITFFPVRVFPSTTTVA